MNQGSEGKQQRPASWILQNIIAWIGAGTLVTIGVGIYSMGSWARHISDKLETVDAKITAQTEALSTLEAENDQTHIKIFSDMSNIKQTIAAYLGVTIKEE